MRKACIWILSMLSGHTVGPKDFYQQWLKLVSVCIYIFIYVEISFSCWCLNTFICFFSCVHNSWLETELFCLAVWPKLQNQSKATPVSSCVITNLGWIYSRKTCVLLLFGRCLYGFIFCGSFAQLKQVINFSNFAWGYPCSANQPGGETSAFTHRSIWGPVTRPSHHLLLS